MMRQMRERDPKVLQVLKIDLKVVRAAAELINPPSLRRARPRGVDGDVAADSLKATDDILARDSFAAAQVIMKANCTRGFISVLSED